MSTLDEEGRVQPRKRDKVRPFELVGFSIALAVFTAIVVIIVTRSLELMAIFAGVAFIAALMIFSLLALSIRPSKEDEEARSRMAKNTGGSAHSI